jgi:hypothetical protein
MHIFTAHNIATMKIAIADYCLLSITFDISKSPFVCKNISWDLTISSKYHVFSMLTQSLEGIKIIDFMLMDIFKL